MSEVVLSDARVRGEVQRIATTERLLVAVDFDGTLAPLVDEPMTARMVPAARVAIASLVAAPDTVVALVSGRSMPDLRIIAEHGDNSAILLAGSHGAEVWTPERGLVEPADTADEVAVRDRLRRHAERLVEDVAGAWIEPKTFGFGLHTRLTDPAVEPAAQEAVDALVRAEAPHWRRRTGHHIVEYAFRHEGKDSAVAQLREITGATGVLFAGDDVTDEDALRSLGDADLGVRVGDPGTGADGPSTAATVIVPDIAAFAGLLAAVAHQRATARE